MIETESFFLRGGTMKIVHKKCFLGAATLTMVAVLALTACSHSSAADDTPRENEYSAVCAIAAEATDTVVSAIVVDGDIPAVAQGWNNMGKIDVSASNRSPFNDGKFQGWVTSF